MGTERDLERLLPRAPLEFDLGDVRDKHVMVTGSDGFIGRLVCERILSLGGHVDEYDLPNGNILSKHSLKRRNKPDAIIHLAAHKQAPDGEVFPGRVSELNIVGTANVVKAGVPVVLASTCKASEPTTVYGASKLIAERIVLNAGGTVLRFVNVLGSSGSVLELWDSQDHHEITNCWRMWMSPREAVDFLIAGLSLPAGRYIPDVGGPEPVVQLYKRCHSQPVGKYSDLRRGDRRVEQLTGNSDQVVGHGPGWLRIVDAWGT